MRPLGDALAYLDELETMLTSLGDKRRVLEWLVDYGKQLEPYPDGLRTPERKVPGCISGVYVACTVENGAVHYHGTSESHIVRGFVMILTTALNGLAPGDVENVGPRLHELMTRTKLNVSMVPSRQNAVGNIYQLMKAQAT